MRSPAGEFDNRARITRPAFTRQGVAQVRTYTEVFKCWAAVSPIASRELERVRSIHPEVTHRIRIRYRSDQALYAQDRFEMGTRVFDIVAPMNVEERNEEWMFLAIERLPAPAAA